MSRSAPPSALATLAEQSHWQQTGRYDEVLRLCDDFPKAYAGKVRAERFGVTPEGRPMVALVASADGTLDPDAARQKRRPVVLLQGGIHAGEIDGKDAGFWLLRDLLDGKALPGVLGKVTVVFAPVVNPDGHERFGPNHRPNQIGPAQMGWRTTGQNLNMNRDYAKADAPEMQALLGLLGRWDPVLYLDSHVTDGAKFQHAVALCMQPLDIGADNLKPLGRRILDAVLGELNDQGHAPLDLYPEFRDKDDPSSGIEAIPSTPRYSDGYWGLRNRFVVLVETHSWKDYATRVKVTRDTFAAFLRQAADQGASWIDAVKSADDADTRPGPDPLALDYGVADDARTIHFLGYAYDIEQSDVSGKAWIRYDDSKPETWEIPLFDKLQPSAVARVPRAGYLVPAAYAGVVGAKLKLHGLSFQMLSKPLSGLDVEAFRATAVHLDGGSFEGHVGVSVEGDWQRERQDLPAGSLYVPTAQRGRRLLVHLLDPAGPDSLLHWGLFLNAFEQKEYMEDYVAEEVARQMLERVPGLADEFERRLEEDEGFRNDPAQRLDFFRRRHPSWDDRLNLYPVFRIDAPPPH